MILFTLRSTSRQYDLDHPAARSILREDLDLLGFFSNPGYAKYYSWFDQVYMPREMINELLWSIRLFDAAATPDTERSVN